MSGDIKLTIIFQDGRYEQVSISEKKPIGALFEKLVEMEGRPIYSLYKDGVEIPKSREMIKYVPLKNGDKLTEGGPKMTNSGMKNMSIHSYQNSILRKKVQLGTIPRENVLELRFTTDTHFAPIDVMVLKTATVDDLKVSISEILQRAVGEIAFYGEEGKLPLGWSGDLRNNSRSYDGSQKLGDLGVEDRKTILKEFRLPKTKQNILREKEAYERKEAAKQEAQRKAAEAAAKEQEEFLRRQKEWEEMQRKAAAAAAEWEAEMQKKKKKQKEERERMRREAEARRARGEGFGHGGPRFSYGSPPPPPREYVAPKSCEQKLRELGIITRKHYLKWTLTVHPDKFPVNLNQKERNARIAKFKEISVCAAEMETKYGKDWDLDKKEGGRSKNRTKRVTRKRKGTRKQRGPKN